jgi:hypothetical protein
LRLSPLPSTRSGLIGSISRNDGYAATNIAASAVVNLQHHGDYYAFFRIDWNLTPE